MHSERQKNKGNLTDSLDRLITSNPDFYENSKCLCGRSAGRPLFRWDREGLPHTVCICMGCGLLRNEPRLTEEFYTWFYAEDTYRELHEGRDFLERSKARLASAPDFIFDKINHIEPKRRLNKVLEFGCGAGWNLIKFQEAGVKPLGIEANETLARLGRDEGLEIIAGSFEALTAVEGKFDLIILNHVLEHLHSPRERLKGFASKLTPGGLIYLGVPNMDNFHHGQLQIAHLYYFSPRTFLALTNSLGLEALAFGDDGIHMFGIFGIPTQAVKTVMVPDRNPVEVSRMLLKYGLYKTRFFASKVKRRLKKISSR